MRDVQNYVVGTTDTDIHILLLNEPNLSGQDFPLVWFPHIQNLKEREGSYSLKLASSVSYVSFITPDPLRGDGMLDDTLQLIFS